MKHDTTAYQPSPELANATEAVCAALANRKKLDEKIDAMPTTIQELTDEIATLTTELSALEGDYALADEGTAPHKAMAKELKDKTDRHAAAQQRLRSAHIRVSGLEDKAVTIDAEVQAATFMLSAELQQYYESVKPALAAEMEAAVKPVIAVLAKVGAFGLPMRDVMRSAFIGNPADFHLVGPGMLSHDWRGTNLLTQPPLEADVSVATEIQAMLAPAVQALVRGRAHPEYVPLARRPKPYVIKGYTHDGTSRKPAPPVADLPNGGRPMPAWARGQA